MSRCVESGNDLARGDRDGALRYCLIPVLIRNVIVISLEATLGDSKLARERVQLLDRRVADEVTPQPIVRGPDRGVDEDRHQELNPVRSRCSASSSTAGRLQKAHRT